jgi:hypothetical protein
LREGRSRQMVHLSNLQHSVDLLIIPTGTSLAGMLTRDVRSTRNPAHSGNPVGALPMTRTLGDRLDTRGMVGTPSSSVSLDSGASSILGLRSGTMLGWIVSSSLVLSSPDKAPAANVTAVCRLKAPRMSSSPLSLPLETEDKVAPPAILSVRSRLGGVST